jgi:hypothetical protein
VFYPPGLAARRRLEYASRCFNSLAINASFYGLLTPETYRRWYRESRAAFDSRSRSESAPRWEDRRRKSAAATG